jgi:hypothetical protein
MMNPSDFDVYVFTFMEKARVKRTMAFSKKSAFA